MYNKIIQMVNLWFSLRSSALIPSTICSTTLICATLLLGGFVPAAHGLETSFCPTYADLDQWSENCSDTCNEWAWGQPVCWFRGENWGYENECSSSYCADNQLDPNDPNSCCYCYC